MSQRWSNNDNTKRRKGDFLPAATRRTEDTHEHNNTSKSTVTQVQDSKLCAQGEYIEFSKDIEKLKEELKNIVSTVCLLVPVSIFTQLSNLTQAYLSY